jgi:hypothetical protein
LSGFVNDPSQILENASSSQRLTITGSAWTEQTHIQPLIATEEEKALFYQESKKGLGFTQEMRREVWLLTTGAQIARYNSLSAFVATSAASEPNNSISMINDLNQTVQTTGQDYLSLVSLYNKKFPTTNKH